MGEGRGEGPYSSKPKFISLAQIDKILPRQLQPRVSLFEPSERLLFNLPHCLSQKPAHLPLAPTEHLANLALRHAVHMDQAQQRNGLRRAAGKGCLQTVTEQSNQTLFGYGR